MNFLVFQWASAAVALLGWALVTVDLLIGLVGATVAIVPS